MHLAAARVGAAPGAHASGWRPMARRSSGP